METITGVEQIKDDVDMTTSAHYEQVAISKLSEVSLQVGVNANDQKMTSFTSLFKQPSSSILKPSVKPMKKKPSTANKPGNATHPMRNCTNNWLESASHLRKTAAINLERNKMTQKERDSEVFVFPVDKSGVYNDKINGTWYTLDKDGFNRAPVCGLPYYDEYFNDKCTWSTLDERSKSIASHQNLLDKGEM